MSGTMNKGSLIKSSGGSGGGGSAKLPTIVTDSGSSLPSASGYQEGDTFLNTSDKKIYKTGYFGYELNTDVTNTGSLNSNDGTITFANGQYIKRNNQFFLWYGSNVNIKIHFKLTSLPDENTEYTLFSNVEGASGTPGLSYYTIVRIKAKKINLDIFKTQYGLQSLQDTDICETVLQTNIDYYLEITKNGTVADITLSTVGYGVSPIETKSITTEDYGHSSTPNGNKIQYYGNNAYYVSTQNDSAFIIGQIYLADSMGEFVVPNTSTLSWDSGTDLTDKTEYADKTNGILYLYENNELVKIGGSLTKKVYTISADNTSTLDVSSDFTKVVDVLKNGVELALTDDYTISSGVITFVTALSTTDKITVKGE